MGFLIVLSKALEQQLLVLAPYLEDPQVTEISINEPQCLFIEKQGAMTQIQNPAITLSYLGDLSILLGNYNQKPINEYHPHFSGTIPGGHRIQIVIPPATEPNKVLLSIRKQTIPEVTLKDLAEKGMFEQGKISIPQLVSWVREKKNMLISGGTGTGKTTFMNALIKEIPLEERLVIIEDTREIQAPHPNKAYLIATAEGGTVENVTMANLKSALRLRPDRILVGEVRGEEAATLLEAAATGHEGVLCTLHASSPALALMRLAMMAERGGLRQQSRQELLAYIDTIIDVVIQIKREGGRRYVSAVWEKSG